MNLNTIVLLLISTIFLHSCADYKTDRTTKKDEKQYYSSIGFALIYSDHHYLNKVVNKKIKNDDFVVMHNFLRINTPIKIINPDNSKFIEDLGADSLDTVELVMAFEEEFNCEIPDSSAEKIFTVKDAIDFIQKQTSK